MERQGRVPPQDLDAERSVLGAMLLEKEALNEVFQSLHADDFYRSAHSRIFEAMMGLYDRSEPVDEITLTAELRHLGFL